MSNENEKRELKKKEAGYWVSLVIKIAAGAALILIMIMAVIRKFA